MAFTQVEMASSSPFHCVLRDQTRRERWEKQSNDHQNFRKNLKNLIESCISSSQQKYATNLHEKSCHAEYNDSGNSVSDGVLGGRYCNAKSNNNNSGNLVNDKVLGGRDCNAKSKAQSQQNKTNIKNDRKSKNNDNWAKAREIVFERETSPTKSNYSVEIPNARVVCALVQKWRDFEAESMSLNSNSTPNSPVSVHSNSTFTENASVLEIYPVTEDSCTDWETTSGPPSWSRNSNATENERIRVVDIIKRLTALNGEEFCDREHLLVNNQWPNENSHEMRGFAGVFGSPKIRGRQAFKDLLVQMERERLMEIEKLRDRKSVTKFSQRGRIQTMLRLRFLRHGVEVKNGSKLNSTTSQRSKRSKGSNIMHLRERFNTGVEHNAADSRSTPRDVINNTRYVKRSSATNTPNAINPSTSNQLKNENKLWEVTQPESPQKNVISHSLDTKSCLTSDCQRVEINHQDVMTPQPSTCQLQDEPSSSLELRNLEPQKSADVITSPKILKGKNVEEHRTQKVLSIASLNDWIKDIPPVQNDWQNQDVCEGLETGTNWTCDFSQPPSDWEDEELSYEHMEENYQDWINDVSRPRSDWEGLRQERYQEMLDHFTDNGDIKTLLQRRSVSTFLSSAFRERIDQLMISRSQGQTNVVEGHKEKHMEEEEREEHKQNENTSQYGEGGEYFDQTPSSTDSPTPSLFEAWNRNQDHDVTDDSFSFTSSSYTMQQCSSSFKNHPPSIEMELLYDLRVQIEQLHHEIYDLRKALRSCAKMQAKTQHSIKHKAIYSPSNAAQEKGNVCITKSQRKGLCDLCCESEVDSLLYRCGHMCTCYKCAKELQCGSGNCPICRTPILDVVRTYLDYKV